MRQMYVLLCLKLRLYVIKCAYLRSVIDSLLEMEMPYYMYATAVEVGVVLSTLTFFILLEFHVI